jgi:hypothetical protein
MMRKKFSRLTIAILYSLVGFLIFTLISCSGGGDDGGGSATSFPRIAGEWSMIANTIYTFDLNVTQSGGAITGSIDSTNTGDPTDPITGTVTSVGNVVFIRERAGAWTQVYTGTVTTQGNIMVMEGTFTHSGETGTFPWRAEKSLVPTPTPGQLLKRTVVVAASATYETPALTALGNGTLQAHVKSHPGSDLNVSFLRMSDLATINATGGKDVYISTACTTGQQWKVLVHNYSGVPVEISITVVYEGPLMST